MQPKLYVGNLAYSAGEADLQTLFETYGTVRNVNIIRDGFTGQSKGFGFVEMASSQEAEKALEQNGKEFMGRNITVSEARPQQDRHGGGGGGGGGRRGPSGRSGGRKDFRRNRY